jgi:thioredoxin reductase
MKPTGYIETAAHSTATSVPGVFACVYRKLDSAIMVMKAAEDGRR